MSHVAKLGLARSRCAPTFSAAARSVRLFIVSRSAFSMVDAAATIWCARPAKRERWRVCGEQTQKAQGGATHHPIHAALHVRIQVLVREEELERKWLEARGGDLAHLAAPPALLTARGFQGAHRAGTLTVTEISGFQGVGRVAALWMMTRGTRRGLPSFRQLLHCVTGAWTRPTGRTRGSRTWSRAGSAGRPSWPRWRRR